MNEYEQKQEERRQRYLDIAASKRSESDRLYNQAHNMASCIPFGQPILCGHHSESRDRNFRKKIHNKFDKSFETAKTADYYKNKAASVGNGGISSDDPDAVIKLKEKLAKLEASQEQMKAANKLIKKGDDEGLIKMGYTPEQIAKLNEPDYCGRVGYPSYQLSNNNAVIRSTKKRIEALEKMAQVEDKANEYEGFMYKEEDNRCQFVFDGKPEEEIRSILKHHGFKWSPSRLAWVRILNGNGRYAAKCVIKKLSEQG